MKPASVLLVDDRPENLLALEAVLAPLGCRLVSARSGEEALKALLQDDFAVIVIDVQMPGIDGFQTAELIRGRERTRLVPIIFVTAVSKEDHSVFRGYAAGAVDYVVKPFDPVVLRSKVEVFVELHERGEALAAREELLRALFEDAPTGMARADFRGRLLRANPTLAATLGRAPGELVGHTLDALGPPSDAGIDAAQRADLLAGVINRYEVERRLLGPGGSKVPVLVSVARASGGDPLEPDLVLHVQDITDRKRAESRRAQLIRAQSARAQAEAASERLRITESIAGAALGAASLDELLRELLDRVVDALGVDSAAVVLTGDGGRTVARAAGATDVELREGHDEVFSRVHEQRAPVALHDVAAAGIDPGSLGADVASLLAVPLIVDGGVIGSLHIGTTAARVFDAEATDLLRLAADRAALAIARTRLHERERRIAEQLQRSLLPRELPRVAGVAMSARYEAGAAGAQVGGDWYDAIALPGGRLALAVGDVVGRGIEAATTMGQMRSALRAFLMQGEHTGTIADRLNQFALGLGETLMTTVIIAVLDPATGVLRYTSAGHPPALVVAADGTAALLDHQPSPPLGVLESPRYPQLTLELPPGSTFVLYTDGLVEQPGEVLDVGLARLTAACADPGEDLEALCERVLRTTRPAGAAPDDVTLLVVRALERLGDRVSVDVTGDAPALQATRDTVRRWLTEMGASTDEVYDVAMACNEACQNTIEHAYEFGTDHFGLELVRSDDVVEVVVRDHGGWRETSTPDRGRGLELMRLLMDSLEVQAEANGTTLSMRRRINREGEASGDGDQVAPNVIRSRVPGEPSSI